MKLIIFYVLPPPLPEPPLSDWFKRPEKLFDLISMKKGKTKAKCYRQNLGTLKNQSRFNLPKLSVQDVTHLFFLFQNVNELLYRI